MGFPSHRRRRVAHAAAPVLLAAFFAAFLPAGAGADGASAPQLPATLTAGLGGSARTLKIATLDLPRPLGTQVPVPAPSVPPATAATPGDVEILTAGVVENLDFGRLRPVSGRAHLELALDLLLDLPLIDDYAAALTEGGVYGPDLAGLPDGVPPVAEAAPMPGSDDFFLDPAILFTMDLRLFRPEGLAPDGTVAPAGTLALASLGPGIGALVPQPQDDAEREGVWPSPAKRLSLSGDQLARAQKCLAEAIYFESRGEPKRGQVAVAQVIVNRVFSGYYPQDVCGTVYQNAHRHLACQFTFACDDVRDVIREPDMWVQAKEIAADMLEGHLWLPSVGRATHYHAYWVHPGWVREMRKLDRIGVHTFYRPRRWGDPEAGG